MRTELRRRSALEAVLLRGPRAPRKLQGSCCWWLQESGTELDLGGGSGGLASRQGSHEQAWEWRDTGFRQDPAVSVKVEGFGRRGAGKVLLGQVLEALEAQPSINGSYGGFAW